ncbi:hypothetical protein ACX6XY_27880 [Streptomyces sp. O3]
MHRIRTIATAAVAAAVAAAALTACGSGDADGKSRGYNADNLTQSETRFMDVVYDVSSDPQEMADATAGEIAKSAEFFRLYCGGDENTRAQNLDDENKMSKADHAKLNAAFTEHLCTGDEDSSADSPGGQDSPDGSDDPEESKSPVSSAHDKDVKITSQGVKTEYGVTTYRVAFTVANSGSEAANYWIEFEAYDKDGDFLGSTGSSAERLGPGKTKNDEVDFYDTEIENGEMSDIDTVKIKKVDYCDGSDDDSLICQL